MTDRQVADPNEKVARPDRILVHDVAATAADLHADSALAGKHGERSAPPTAEEIAVGRQLGAAESGMGKGGTGTLFVDGKQVAQSRIEHTQPMMFSADETADVGVDLGIPMAEAIGSEAKSRFNGRIPKLTIEV